MFIRRDEDVVHQPLELVAVEAVHHEAFEGRDGDPIGLAQGNLKPDEAQRVQPLQALPVEPPAGHPGSLRGDDPGEHRPLCVREKRSFLSEVHRALGLFHKRIHDPPLQDVHRGRRLDREPGLEPGPRRRGALDSDGRVVHRRHMPRDHLRALAWTGPVAVALAAVRDLDVLVPPHVQQADDVPRGEARDLVKSSLGLEGPGDQTPVVTPACDVQDRCDVFLVVVGIGHHLVLERLEGTLVKLWLPEQHRVVVREVKLQRPWDPQPFPPLLRPELRVVSLLHVPGDASPCRLALDKLEDEV
mmetsp:Transcript_15497/g.38237  ORF Transcript_15497/g.38237 Transcript_15497/m.38237 type:complete len:301 (-) Transcript_15497:51-953(-)